MSVVSVNQYYEDQAKFRKEVMAAIPKVQYASVVEFDRNGDPIIQFMGESLPSQKSYVSFKNHALEIGDRVQLIDGIIQGGWTPR